MDDLQQIAALLLKNRGGRADWDDISRLEGKECSKKVANKFLICCLLDWQWDSKVAWKKGEDLVEKLAERGDPEDVWVTISSFSKDDWDSKYEEYGRPHRFHRGYKRLWGIANDICARYEGDARNIWSGKPPFEALVHLWALGAGDQISRMIVGALRDCGQIKGGTGDVKADVHLRRVLGRAVYGEEISGADAAKVIQLTRNLNADPWQLDLPLRNVGKSYCRPTSPNCPSCYLRPHCVYYRRHRAAGVPDSA
jgi:endonuclease III